MERKTAHWLCEIGDAVRETRTILSGGRGGRRFGEERRNEDWGRERSPGDKETTQLAHSLQSLRNDLEQRLHTAYQLPASDITTIASRLASLETRQTQKENTVNPTQSLYKQRSLFQDSIDVMSQSLSDRAPKLVSRTEFEDSVARANRMFESERGEVIANCDRVEQAGKRASEGNTDFLQDFTAKTTLIATKSQMDATKADLSDRISSSIARGIGNFQQLIDETGQITAQQLEQQAKTSQKSLCDTSRDHGFDLQGKIDELMSQIATLRSEIHTNRVKSSVESAEESLSQMRADKHEGSLRDCRRRVEEHRSAEPKARMSDLEQRISTLESKIAQKSHRKSEFFHAVDSLHSRISALELLSKGITDDSEVDLSIGITDQSISILEKQPSNSDVMLISLNEVEDSDLESQGYVSPHLSPMNGLMIAAGGMKGTGKFSFQQDAGRDEEGKYAISKGSEAGMYFPMSDPPSFYAHSKPSTMPQKPSLKIPEPRVSEEPRISEDPPSSDQSATASNPHLSSSAEFGDEEISLP